jgi:hypothetical protein
MAAQSPTNAAITSPRCEPSPNRSRDTVPAKTTPNARTAVAAAMTYQKAVRMTRRRRSSSAESK